MPQHTAPRGLNAMGFFLCFGALMSALAGVTLLWRGTVLERVWALNPVAYRQLTLFGRWIGGMFLLLSAALALAARGWFTRRRWGWMLTIAIMATEVAGNVINVIRGDLLRGSFGVLVAAALVFYLLRPRVRTVFGARGAL